MMMIEVPFAPPDTITNDPSPLLSHLCHTLNHRALYRVLCGMAAGDSTFRVDIDDRSYTVGMDRVVRRVEWIDGTLRVSCFREPLSVELRVIEALGR